MASCYTAPRWSKIWGHETGRKIEYLNHIASVVFEIMNVLPKESDINADFAIFCAVLHDTLEDKQLTLEDLAKEFGEEIALGVQALTKIRT